MRNIQGSLAKGKEGEQLALHQFSRCGATGGLNEDYELRYEYDIWFAFKDKKHTAEVKYDLMANKTGNIALEFFNVRTGETSGIARTKAEIWLHILSEGEIYLTTVKTLKDFISNNEPDKIIARGGDKNAKLYIYSKVRMVEGPFLNIATLSNPELTALLKELKID